jgi:hypothetical protein
MRSIRGPRVWLLAASLLGGCTGADAGAGAGADAGAAADAASGSDTSSAHDATSAADATPPTADAGCGYHDAGRVFDIASGLSVCLPPTVCNPETCPPPLGTCVDGGCQFQGGYEGLRTLPEAWVTYYCELSTGGCHGVTQGQYPEVTAAAIAASTG